jgi:hypothetical protein
VDGCDILSHCERKFQAHNTSALIETEAPSFLFDLKQANSQATASPSLLLHRNSRLPQNMARQEQFTAPDARAPKR